MMKVKANAEAYCTSEFMYDLVDGGYVEPEKFLENDNDVQAVEDALEVIREFRRTLDNNGLLIEG